MGTENSECENYSFLKVFFNVTNLLKYQLL